MNSYSKILIICCYMNHLKNNMIIRGIYFLLKRYFCCNRSGFGYIADNVILTPPMWLNRKKNIYLFENTNLAANSYISAYNAKFIVKRNCALADGLTVHTGNHLEFPECLLPI